MEQIILKLSMKKVLPEHISCDISSTGTFFTGTNFGSHYQLATRSQVNMSSIHVFYNDFKLTDDKCSVYKKTCLTSGTYFTDKELISPGEEQISQIQNLFHQVRNKSHKHGTYFTR